MIPMTFADPITLTAIGAAAGGLAGLGGLAGQLFSPKPNPSMPAPPPPSSQPVGSPTSNAPGGGPSFLAAAAATPSQQSLSNKSLLGQ